MLVNGILSDSVAACDRGLLYGDGVFRTMRVACGRILSWQRHYRKLQQDCAALMLPCPEKNLLFNELSSLIELRQDCVAKVIITRGQGARGYARDADAQATRVLSLSPPPAYPEHFYTQGICLRVCNLRLAHQPALAGIKHLNRLENVLAASEWDAPDVTEGVLLDNSCNVIECTRSNLFIINNDKITTPDLSSCGVAGIARDRVMEWAKTHNVQCFIKPFGMDELFAASEVFVVNSVIGLWPVRKCQECTWDHHPVSLKIQNWLNNHEID